MTVIETMAERFRFEWITVREVLTQVFHQNIGVWISLYKVVGVVVVVAEDVRPGLSRLNGQVFPPWRNVDSNGGKDLVRLRTEEERDVTSLCPRVFDVDDANVEVVRVSHDPAEDTN